MQLIAYIPVPKPGGPPGPISGSSFGLVISAPLPARRFDPTQHPVVCCVSTSFKYSKSLFITLCKDTNWSKIWCIYVGKHSTQITWLTAQRPRRSVDTPSLSCQRLHYTSKNHGQSFSDIPLRAIFTSGIFNFSFVFLWPPTVNFFPSVPQSDSQSESAKSNVTWGREIQTAK